MSVINFSEVEAASIQVEYSNEQIIAMSFMYDELFELEKEKKEKDKVSLVAGVEDIIIDTGAILNRIKPDKKS